MELKFIYTICLALLVVLFVGFGIAAFYPVADGAQPSEAQASYYRVVAVIAMLAAIAVMACSIAMKAKLGFIADGLLLGGALTLAYALIVGISMGDDDRFRFLVVTVGLVVTLVVGYVRFINVGDGTKEEAPPNG